MISIVKNILRKKILSAVVAIALISVGYYGYHQFFISKNVNQNQYVTAPAQKGMLIISVSGSGQVSVSDQIDIKPKVSGDIVYTGVKNGQEVSEGTLLAQIDATDAQKAVRDAQIGLESAKLSLQRLQQSSADADKLKEDAFNSIVNAFLDLPSVVNGAEVILNSNALVNYQDNYNFYLSFLGGSGNDKAKVLDDGARNDTYTARVLYDQTTAIYKSTSRYSDINAVLDLLDKTLATSKAAAQAVKSEQNLLDYMSDYASNNPGKILPATVNTYKTNLQTYITKMNGYVSALIDSQNSVKNAPLDISSQELAVKQRENALTDAQEKLADYFIRAPFNGIVAKINVVDGDPVSGSIVIATFITKQRSAEISLNEVDVAKVKIGQKATLTFDAVPDLTITGQVSEIDTVGTISQGVVTYNVKIAFDTQDERVKPGMSISAAIITDSKQDALLVSNSAIKQQRDTIYVEVLANGSKTPKQQTVQIGLANDTMTEIVSGLNEGDKVVTQTISAQSSQGQSQQNNVFRIPGIGGGEGGGGFRSGGGEIPH